MALNRQRLLTFAACMVVVTTAVSQECATFETFNIGLTISVAETAKRRTLIADALKSSTSDFLCLQEVLMEKDMSYLLDQVKSVFPHHYSPIHADKDVLRKPDPASHLPSPEVLTPKDTACQQSDLVQLNTAVLPCANLNNCTTLSGFQFAECLSMKCGDLLRGIKDNCVTCLFINGFQSLDAAVQECGVPGEVHNRINAPGLLVLSKEDMRSVSYFSYFPCNSPVFPTGYIQANLSSGIPAVCTHLSANLPGYFDYDLDFENYYEQQKEEIIILGRTFSDRDIVMLGDLNLGPRSQSDSNPENKNEGQFEANYHMLREYGFTSPYVCDDGRCTYCNNNSITIDLPNQILDHVMIKGQSLVSIGASRIYDAKPELSDHYGVKLDVCEAG